ncbi:NAD-binding protein [Schizopora paradoxa]|uniref:NAD-binding protein n=1 Tax=Schizopora paradoxa TaxID=27342 RepID=A0A0H2SCL4_9AGAM|nr:NAD-binding protein [Schizopora paradoxa]
MAHNILVVGGNGFIGSAVCRAALSRGMTVTSISSSGRPFRTPKGHAPAWTSKVTWLKADALDPPSYAHLLPSTTAVVHTLGTLFEDTGYKEAIRTGDVGGVVSSFLKSLSGGRVGGGNPLQESQKSGATYETLNRDAALRVCESFASYASGSSSPKKTFVYVSAEDIFRPFVPARYIETKREAERGINDIALSHPGVRAAYIRPSLVYHSHIRPLTTPFATLLDLSATLHRSAPNGVPTPSGIFRLLSEAGRTADKTPSPQSEFDVPPSPFASMANAMVVPPIHVDHVGEAICKVLQDENVDGVVNVSRMRELIGWVDKGNAHANVEGTT